MPAAATNELPLLTRKLPCVLLQASCGTKRRWPLAGASALYAWLLLTASTQSAALRAAYLLLLAVQCCNCSFLTCRPATHQASCPFHPPFCMHSLTNISFPKCLSPVSCHRPPIVLAKGADVPLTAGAPLAVAGQQLPGYVALPGRAAFDYGMFECAESAW